MPFLLALSIGMVQDYLIDPLLDRSSQLEIDLIMIDLVRLV